VPFESLQQLIAWNPPPIKQIVDNHILLEETKLCLYAPPKYFKSLIATQLGLCIAAGESWLGFQTTQAKVALIQSEIPKVAYRERTLPMARNLTVPNNMFYTSTDRSFKLDSNKHINQLRSDLHRIKPEILILDPWYKMLTTEDPRTYSYTQDKMDSLIEEFGISIIIVHHDTKPITSYSGQIVSSGKPRGPRTVEGWFDSLIEITGDISTDNRTLKFETRHSHTLIPELDIKLDRRRLWASRI